MLESVSDILTIRIARSRNFGSRYFPQRSGNHHMRVAIDDDRFSGAHRSKPNTKARNRMNCAARLWLLQTPNARQSLEFLSLIACNLVVVLSRIAT